VHTIKYSVLLLSGLLLGCNATAPARPDMAPTPENGEVVQSPQAGGDAAPAATGQTDGAEMSRRVASQLDQLGGRLVLMQEQLLQLRADSQRLQEQNQMVLNRLQLISGNALSAGEGDTAGTEATDTTGTEQLDSVIGQLMQLLNSLDNAGPGVSGGEFAVTTTYTRNGDWILLRYHRRDGTTWLADGGGWRLLSEQQPPSPGDYQVLVHRADQDSKGYVAVRIDRTTGYSWWLNDTYWQEYRRD